MRDSHHLRILAWIFRGLGGLLILSVPLVVLVLHGPIDFQIRPVASVEALSGVLITFITGVSVFLYGLLLPVCAWGIQRGDNQARVLTAILCALAIPPTLFGVFLLKLPLMPLPLLLLAVWFYGLWAVLGQQRS